MKHNRLTFAVLDKEITGVASDYLVECKDKDGATIVKEWVTLPTGSIHKDTQFSLVGPSNGPLRILPIKEQNQMLQQQFGVQRYPTVCFVNVTKEADKFNLAPLSFIGYLQGGPEVWITNAKAIINGGK